MAKHIEPRPTGPAPGGNVGPSSPNKQTIQAPRPTTAPGKPARDPNRGHALGAVDAPGAPANFSSRLPGQPFTPRPDGS